MIPYPMRKNRRVCRAGQSSTSYRDVAPALPTVSLTSSTRTRRVLAPKVISSTSPSRLVGRLGGLAVDRDMSRIARFIRHSAPLDDTGNLQILVKAHISSGQP